MEAQFLKELSIRVRQYKRAQSRMDEVEHNLLDYCVDYLQKKGLWDDVDGILEVLNHIPSGYTRFILYERVFELKKSQQADQPGHIPRDQ